MKRTAKTTRSPDRVFLDANVLFSAAWREGGGLSRFREIDATLITSSYAVAEARRNLPVAARDRLVAWLTSVEIVPDVTEGELPAGMTLPPKDRPILLSALAANATYLVTGDRAHFGPWFGRVIHGLWIGTSRAYLEG